MESIYVVNVHPIMIPGGGLCWDLYYVIEDSIKVECIRIFNIRLSFLLARLPGLLIEQFNEFVNTHLRGIPDISVKIRDDLHENGHFRFGKKLEYAEISSNSPITLKRAYTKLFNGMKSYYKRLNRMPDKLDAIDPFDRDFYENTESPFRYTESTLTVSNSVYHLAAKYNVPLVGGAKVNTALLVSTYPTVYEPDRRIPIRGLDASRGIENIIIRDDSVDFKVNMRLMAYDIETYTINDMDPSKAENYIFNIGLGIFNLTDPKPLRRISIITKPVSSNQPTEYDRYGNEVHTIDDIEYVITKNEQQLLQTFIGYLRDIQPQFICGFNSFGFDDRFIYTRSEMFGLKDQLLQAFTPYDINELSAADWFRPFMPTFREFELKIDGDKLKNSASIRNGMVIPVDVYKLMLKEDAKRFTQHGRGNLDTMLEVYDIRNPYNGKQLSKSGLTYSEMFRKWDNNEDIYSIALYCCQDAWICGTLLVKRAKLSDLIEMANTTYTTISDSIYRADSVRVANTLMATAYREGFALMDTAYDHRHEATRDPIFVHYGNKQYDTRTIVGGDVKNVHPGKHECVVALDYNSMYPNLKIGCNFDSSSRVSKTVLDHPDDYGLTILRKDTVTDMFGTRPVYHIRSQWNEDEIYIVEGYYSERKLDVKALLSLQQRFRIATTGDERDEIIKEFRSLWPEYGSDDILAPTINQYKQTIEKMSYFVQSPWRVSLKYKTDRAMSTYYSLKCKMLDGLRLARDAAKRDLKTATINGDNLGKIRFNAKQLSLKVVSNSEYGTSINEFFPHWDPDIAATVTYNSRALIHFLTEILGSSKLYVDQQYIADNKGDVDRLISIGAMSIAPFHGRLDTIQRKRSLARMWDDYQFICRDVWEISIEPSTVIYQDTDSNYYSNDYIVRYYMTDNVSPDVLNECMKTLIAHNNAVGYFIKKSIGREPIGVGFEGSFIICRYMNRKKKYYGKKWTPNLQLKLPDEAYENGVLKRHYNQWWSNKSIIPMESGDYILIDPNRIITQNTNILDYIGKYGIKCTGVDVVRRDQFRFINFTHLLIMQNDLRLLRYAGDNQWTKLTVNNTLSDIVADTLQAFNDVLNKFRRIANFESDEKPAIPFTPLDFIRTVAYRPDKINSMGYKLVEKLKREGKEQFIPGIGGRMSYLIMSTEEVRQSLLAGRRHTATVTELARVLDDVYAETRSMFPEEEFDAGGLNISYNEFIDATIISNLDTYSYINALCKAIALYVVEDESPDLIASIDNGELSVNAASEAITKVQSTVANKYLAKFFPQCGQLTKAINTARKNSEKRTKKQLDKDDTSILADVIPNIFVDGIDNRDVIGAYLSQLITRTTNANRTISRMRGWLEQIMLNGGNMMAFDNDQMRQLFMSYANSPDKLWQTIEDARNRLLVYDRCIEILKRML